MNKAEKINTFKSDNTFNSDTGNIKTQHQQIMTAITNRFLKFKPMIKIQMVTSYTFFVVFTFYKISSFP